MIEPYEVAQAYTIRQTFYARCYLIAIEEIAFIWLGKHNCPGPTGLHCRAHNLGVRCHPRYEKGLLRINECRRSPVDILESDFTLLVGRCESFDGIDEGLETGNDASLGCMLVDF